MEFAMQINPSLTIGLLTVAGLTDDEYALVVGVSKDVCIGCRWGFKTRELSLSL